MPQSTVHIGIEEKQGECTVYVLSAGAYTTTMLVMVDRVKGGGVHPPPSPDWADFTIMMECTPESGHCHSPLLEGMRGATSV
jgi:hypothetical protein